MKCIPDQDIFAIQRNNRRTCAKNLEPSVVTEGDVPVGARVIAVKRRVIW
jgi:hypothetical protein